MPRRFRNQIIGLIRFSYPAENGFSRTAPTPAALEAMLYAPERLELRFHLFSQLTLPSLLAQTDSEFTTVVLIGKSFPDAARQRLTTLLAPLQGAKIVALPPLPHYYATRRAFASATQGRATHLTGFRLDDDDAIDRDHIARMRQRSEGLLRLLGPDLPFVTGSNRGYFLERRPDDNRLVRVVEKAPLGIGLALTAPAGTGENIFRRNHRLAPQFYNAFTDAETPAFIRSVHADNDSDAHASGLAEPIGWGEANQLIERDFPFTTDALRRI